MIIKWLFNDYLTQCILTRPFFFFFWPKDYYVNSHTSKVKGFEFHCPQRAFRNLLSLLSQSGRYLLEVSIFVNKYLVFPKTKIGNIALYGACFSSRKQLINKDFMCQIVSVIHFLMSALDEQNIYRYIHIYV